jgi:hypothetical protein
VGTGHGKRNRSYQNHLCPCQFVYQSPENHRDKAQQNIKKKRDWEVKERKVMMLLHLYGLSGLLFISERVAGLDYIVYG